jgi:hypothetical protein
MRYGLQNSAEHTTKQLLLTIIAAVICAGLIGLVAYKCIRVVREAFTSERNSTTYFVSTGGDNQHTGRDKNAPLKSIQTALHKAQPGDTIQLADGTYYESIETVRAGTKHAPITIHGTKRAILMGERSRIVEIRHSYITLDGFHINGQYGAGTAKQDFRDKLIYAQGSEIKKGVEHVRITNMLIENAGGECVRLRYFARYNEISHSTIRNCGVYDFRFADGGKNGEGVYIGTAPEQRKDGRNPTKDIDQSAYNHIHHNTIETHGNECVDIKEGSRENTIEYNTCRFQNDSDSGGFDARGDKNIFRHNTVRSTAGAAIRLGGDTEEDGIRNDVYDNTFIDNAGGALNIQTTPQGKICNNSVTPLTGEDDHDNGIDPMSPCE